MRLINWIKAHKSHAVLIALEMVLIVAVCFVALLNKRKIYSHTFEFDDYKLAEDVIVMAYDSDGFSDDCYVSALDGTTSTGIILSTPAITLAPGTYRVSVLYDANTDYNFMAADCTGSLPFESAPITLSPDTNHVTLTLTTFSANDYFFNIVFGGVGGLNIHSISVVSTNARYYRYIIYAVLASLIAEFIFFLSNHKQSVPTALILTATTFVALIPLFSKYLYVGADLPFHLCRIEGIAEGLRNKIFPVKVAPFWANDYGYAVGVFYGDLLLYFPAMLRLFGFSVQAAFKIFVAAITIGTVTISYFSFKDIFTKKSLATVSTVFYTLAIYRLMDVYSRTAVGEYIALMFMPLFAMGIWGILRSTDKPSFKYVILASFGITGILGSHVLSTEMVALFLVITLLAMASMTFRKHTIAALLKVVGFSVLLNIGFLLPFVDFYMQNINIKSDSWAGTNSGLIQGYGLYLRQLFAALGNANGGNWLAEAGTSNEICYKIGVYFIVFMILFFIAFFKAGSKRKSDRRFKIGLTISILSIVAMFMTTLYFPWDTLTGFGKIFKTLIAPIQFPWRFLSIATLLLAILTGITVDVAKDYLEGLLCKGFYILAGTLFVASLVWYYHDFIRTNTEYNVFDAYEVQSNALYSAEYLLEGTDTSNFNKSNVIVSDVEGATIERAGFKYHITISGSAGKGWIELPLNYYKYYQAKDLNKVSSASVEAGDNNRVRVVIPEGFNGKLIVSWCEPIHWRIAELISVITFVAMCFLLRPGKEPNKEV